MEVDFSPEWENDDPFEWKVNKMSYLESVCAIISGVHYI